TAHYDAKGNAQSGREDAPIRLGNKGMFDSSYCSLQCERRAVLGKGSKLHFAPKAFKNAAGRSAETSKSSSVLLKLVLMSSSVMDSREVVKTRTRTVIPISLFTIDCLTMPDVHELPNGRLLNRA